MREVPLAGWLEASCQDQEIVREHGALYIRLEMIEPLPVATTEAKATLQIGDDRLDSSPEVA